jgi:hypothetical protein
MALYSLRLALTGTLTGLVMSAAAVAADWRTPAALALMLVAPAFYSLSRTAQMWRSEATRAVVVTAVASG